MSAQRQDGQFLFVLTDADVAAEACMCLVVNGILPHTPETIAKIAEATRLPVRTLRDAWRRIDTRGYRPPESVRRPVLAAVPDAPVRRQPVDLEQQRRSRKRRGWAEANPAPGMRRCARCGDVLPEEMFPWKDGAKKTRRSYDSDCWKAKQRERYLSLKKIKALNAVGLVFKITEADELGSLCCTECGNPFAVGDMARADRVSLRHDDCIEATYARHGVTVHGQRTTIHGPSTEAPA